MSCDYCDYILDLLSPARRTTAKRMFGGFGLFRDGLMFGLIVDDMLHFKVGAATQAEYEGLKSEPFRYMRKGKSIALSYWQVPVSVIEDEAALQEWANKAYRTAIAAKDSRRVHKNSFKNQSLE